MAFHRVAAAVFLLLLFIGYINLYTVLDPSQDTYITPPPLGEDLYRELWGFDWSRGLDVRVESFEAASYRGSTISVAKISFSLLPGTPDCRIYGWLYGSPSSEGPWILLVHGLGGDHTFFEETLGGYKIAYELALRGFKVLSIDAAGHGESCIPGGESWRDRATTLEPGEFFLYYVYLSGVRAVEAAEALGAEPGRIAVMGVSMGGLTSYTVASLHPSVTLAIPIVASGCLSCMIQSGGLANLVGPSDAPVDGETVEKLSSSDPLSYIKLAASKGLLEGKASTYSSPATTSTSPQRV
ncbi:alpha/beta fold hydrolase [Aeropyrum camini]|uniref:alpha/beta fold hydrolase n=1 Tax=Aeropyrum camini TaxID=229980 RepID=UPI0007880536|nr:alpha/beta fold hydrolase [Aeropyrum camini]